MCEKSDIAMVDPYKEIYGDPDKQIYCDPDKQILW